MFCKKKSFWQRFTCTGGEETNPARVYLTGAISKTFIYNLQLDQWQDSVSLSTPLAGHCMIKVSIKPYVNTSTSN
jgi:hypothetical protein